MSTPETPELRVVPFDRARTDEVASVLARAFAADPYTSQLVPSDRAEERLTRLFRSMITLGLAENSAIDLAIDANGYRVVGAAIWIGPHRAGGGLRKAFAAFRAAPDLIRAAGKRVGTTLRAAAHSERARPTADHWYLASIGADPGTARRGVGKALLTHRLALVDEANLPAYLESSKPENDPYYERYGFVTIGTIRDHELPPISQMWRAPKA